MPPRRSLPAAPLARGLRRRVRAGQITEPHAWTVLDTWRRLAATRYAVLNLLDRMWQLRANLSAYDAGQVALAEALDCPLVTADARPSRAPGIHCPVPVVPAHPGAGDAQRFSLQRCAG